MSGFVHSEFSEGKTALTREGRRMKFVGVVDEPDCAQPLIVFDMQDKNIETYALDGSYFLEPSLMSCMDLVSIL